MRDFNRIILVLVSSLILFAGSYPVKNPVDTLVRKLPRSENSRSGNQSDHNLFSDSIIETLAITVNGIDL